MTQPFFEKPLIKMRSEPVFLDPFPALGHVNAFLDLGKWLKRNGFSPVYLMDRSYIPHVTQEGGNCTEVSPFLIPVGKAELKEKRALRFFLDNLVGGRQKTSNLYREEAEKSYDRAIKEGNVKVVLLDDHYATKALFYRNRGLKVILVSTRIFPFRHAYYPPFQSIFVPDESFLSEMYVTLLWVKARLRRRWGRLVNFLLSGGQTDLKLLTAVYGWGEYILDRDRAFGIGFKNLPMIGTYPRTFDLVDMEQAGRGLYFGLLPSSPKKEVDDNRLAGILKSVTGSGELLVYCSLGTVTVEYTSVCLRFFNRLLKGAASHPQIRIILNVGKHLDISNLYDLPGSVHVFNHVPQAQLLKRVDVMINHGGLNTIKECIAEEVPMLVYPLSPHWDQPGCGARVVAKEIGLRGDIRKDSQHKIYRKLNELLNNLPRYRAAIARFREKTEKQNQAGEGALLSLIESEIQDVGLESKSVAQTFRC